MFSVFIVDLQFDQEFGVDLKNKQHGALITVPHQHYPCGSVFYPKEKTKQNPFVFICVLACLLFSHVCMCVQYPFELYAGVAEFASSERSLTNTL